MLLCLGERDFAIFAEIWVGFFAFFGFFFNGSNQKCERVSKKPNGCCQSLGCVSCFSLFQSWVSSSNQPRSSEIRDWKLFVSMI